jgi:hypothetical protein
LPAELRLDGSALSALEEGVFLVATAIPEDVVFPRAEAILRVFLFHIVELENFFDILPQQVIVEVNRTDYS